MKIKVAVLFGGKSVEHEISVISAVQAMKSLDKDKYEVLPIYITKNNEFYYGESLVDIDAYKDIPSLLRQCQRVWFNTEGKYTYICRQSTSLINIKSPKISHIDVALPIVHGTNVEDGTIAGFLRLLNLPFVGCNVLASAVGMDKFTMKILLKDAGFPVLDALRFTLTDFSDVDGIIKKTETKFPYPVIVKPINLGSSVGITKAADKNGLRDAINTAFSFADKIIIEPCITNLKEINCAVLGDYSDAMASECEEPVSTDEILSYSDKYLNKGSGSKGMAGLKRKIPAEILPDLKKQIQKTAIDAFRYLDLNGVTRIDFLTDKDTGEFWLNEINTIPGSLSFYLWEPIGVNYKELLNKLIGLALKRHRLEESITYSFDTNILSLGGALGSKGKK